MMLDHWFSYSLVDFIPLDIEVYVNLFSRANNALWPWTLLAVLLGIVVIVLVNRRHVRYSCFLLALAWCFCAYQFHFSLLGELHFVGYYLAGLFFLQGCLLIVFAIKAPAYKRPSRQQMFISVTIMLIGMIGFLITPILSERSWQSTEVFGIAPNPTSWLTLGALLASNIRRWWLWVIPIIWFLFSILVLYAIS